MSFYREIYIKTLRPHIIPEDEYTVKILFFSKFLRPRTLRKQKKTRGCGLVTYMGWGTLKTRNLCIINKIKNIYINKKYI